MRADVVKAARVLHPAQGVQHPELQGKIVPMCIQARTSYRRQDIVGCPAQKGSAADSVCAVRDSNVVAHSLNLSVALFVHPRQVLKLGVEIRPFFERSWFLQTHVESALEIWSTGVWGIDVAVKLRIRKS